MMKLLLKFLPVFLPFICFGQNNIKSFAQIDNYVSHIPTAEPNSLARSLTSTYTKDIEKVRAIFSWITQNISYQVGAYRRGRNEPIVLIDNEVDDTTALQPLDLRVASIVLDRKLAVCDGYARLFKTLCDYAGIQSEIIQGYANGNSANAPKFRSNHKWNAVMIDSSWHLIDATWASGYVTFWGNQFIQHLNEQYFLADPNTFIKDHYPEDLRWTLLQNPPVLREFNKAPYQHMAFYKHKITSYKPATGVIEVALGDSITIELETDEIAKKFLVSDVITSDSVTIATMDSLSIKPQKIGNKVKYTYNASSPAAQWLQVVYDDEVILKYKLNIKKTEVAVIK